MWLSFSLSLFKKQQGIKVMWPYNALKWMNELLRSNMIYCNFFKNEEKKKKSEHVEWKWEGCFTDETMQLKLSEFF